MTNPDQEKADQEVRETGRRIRRNAFAAYLIFAAIIVISGDFRGLVGLTCSGAVAMISFLWLEEIVNSILQPSAQPHPGRLVLRAVARLVLLGVALLVSIFVARFTALSVLFGFSIVVVGIIGEALYSAYRSFVA